MPSDRILSQIHSSTSFSLYLLSVLIIYSKKPLCRQTFPKLVPMLYLSRHSNDSEQYFKSKYVTNIFQYIRFKIPEYQINSPKLSFKGNLSEHINVTRPQQLIQQCKLRSQLCYCVFAFIVRYTKLHVPPYRTRRCGATCHGVANVENKLCCDRVTAGDEHARSFIAFLSFLRHM